MNILFAGTPEFAAMSLRALLASRHRIGLVLTRPDRAAGRGMKTKPSPVKQLADLHGLPVLQPVTLKSEETQAALRKVGADIMVVAAYGLILPQAVLDLTPSGAINIHASLLPRWRGAAPIQRAILAGDDETGICIMQMDAGLDTGPVLLKESVPISAEDDAGTLHDRLAALGAGLIVTALDRLEERDPEFRPQPQPAQGESYARKIEKAEARIDWSEAAVAIDRRVRAFRPSPGAVTTLNGRELKLWRIEICHGANAALEPGTVIRAGTDGIRVACGDGAVDLLELQRAGGNRTGVAEFLRGNPVAEGAKLGS